MIKDDETTAVIPKLFKIVFFCEEIAPQWRCNGTRLQVKHFRRNVVGLTVLT
jgi:hypothetical protein